MRIAVLTIFAISIIAIPTGAFIRGSSPPYCSYTVMVFPIGNNFYEVKNCLTGVSYVSKSAQNVVEKAFAEIPRGVPNWFNQPGDGGEVYFQSADYAMTGPVSDIANSTTVQCASQFGTQFDWVSSNATTYFDMSHTWGTTWNGCTIRGNQNVNGTGFYLADSLFYNYSNIDMINVGNAFVINSSGPNSANDYGNLSNLLLAGEGTCISMIAGQREDARIWITGGNTCAGFKVGVSLVGIGATVRNGVGQIFNDHIYMSFESVGTAVYVNDANSFEVKFYNHYDGGSVGIQENVLNSGGIFFCEDANWKASLTVDHTGMDNRTTNC